MKFLLKVCYAFVIPLLMMQNIYSQSSDTLQSFTLHDSIVVIANRYTIPMKSLTNSVDEITTDRFPGIANHSVLQLVDLLAPSTFVLDKKILGYGVGITGAGSINLRGLGGKPNSGILILINGRPDFMGIFGHPLPDVYGIEEVEKVEIIKGASATVFGSNAMGGVVNLKTKGIRENKITLGAQAGNYRTNIQNAGINLILGENKIGLTVSHKNSAGHIDASDFRGWHLAARYQRILSERWHFSLAGRYVPYNFNDPFMTNDVADLGYTGIIRRGMIDIRLEGETNRFKNSFHLYTNLGHHRFNDGFESHDFTYGFSSYQVYRFSSSLQFGFGLDALHFGGKARNIVFPQAPPDPDLHTINTIGGYSIFYFSPMPRLSVKGGLRFQHTSLDIQEFTPTAGLSYLLNSRWKLYVNYNRGFRLPTLQELYLFPPSNKELQPEYVDSYETGSTVYLNHSHSIKFSYYYNSIENSIIQISNPHPPPPVVFSNSGEAEQWGLEISWQFNAFNSLSSQISYSYLEPDHLTAFNPKNLLKYYFNFKWRKMMFSFYGKQVLSLYAGNNNTGRLDDYHLLNLSLAYPISKIKINCQFKNLLNSKYEILPGYPAPDFHFLIGADLNLQPSF